MQHKNISVGLSIGLALCLAALRAGAADDVTIQVLDDVKDVTKVVADVDHALHAAEGARAAKPDVFANEQQKLSAGPARPLESGPRPQYFGTIIDREEDSEGEIEDFDVPKDVVVPPAN
jgi:hypothetical protein